MDTPLEESNLAMIGSDEDKAAKQAAAKLEVNWDGVGQKVGLEIWRVENKRDEHGNPDFGINAWPKRHYGEFFTGDSYIVLQTSKDPESDAFLYDIYFWIGSESSQDEYGVAAYKANELDDLLGDVPVQHRETEGYESEEFLECFPKGIRYLKGGVESGFRHVEEDGGTVELPTRLMHVRKKANNKTMVYTVNVSYKSLNEGDAFILDASDTLYTWYGPECSPFEKSKAVEVAHNIKESRNGHAALVEDVEDDNEAFWEAIGGKGTIAPASSYSDDDIPCDKATKMYILTDEDSMLKIEAVSPPDKSHLKSDAAAMMDISSQVYLWFGKESSVRVQQQATVGVQRFLKNLGREKNTKVVVVKEGKESRCRTWAKAFS